MTDKLHTCRFSINTWQHLYALHRAVLKTDTGDANQLRIHGVNRNETLFNRQDTPIELVFSLQDAVHYPVSHDNRLILAPLHRSSDGLKASIPVTSSVFAELKKNLAEYMGIEGIHIIVSLGLQVPDSDWRENNPAAIIELEYAMKGDGG